MKTELTGPETAKIIQDAFTTIEIKGANDTKLLAELNNSLNWILTLSAILFAFNNRSFTGTPSGQEIIALMVSRIIFFLMALILLAHKMTLFNYELEKFTMTDRMRLLAVDLQANPTAAQSLFDFTRPFQTLDFVKAFRDGKLYYHDDKESYLRSLEIRNTTLKAYKKFLTRSFKLCLILCLLYLIISVILLRY